MKTKICTKCDVSKTLLNFAKRTDQNGNLRSTCKECDNKRRQKRRRKDIKRLLVAWALYRKKNKNRIQKNYKKMYAADIHRFRDINRSVHQKSRDTMDDMYIKSLLIRGAGRKIFDNPLLIQAKRAQMKLYRQLKNQTA